jgi:hypothetical protein
VLRALNKVLFAAACGLFLGISGLASAEAVLLAVGVDVNPGKLEQYVSTVSKGNAVIERLGVEGTLRIWQASVAGQATGGVVVGIEYPSLAAYADATTKMQADSEWQAMISGLADIRTLTGTSLYRELDLGSTGAPGGGTLQAVLVRVKPGKLDAYLGEVKKLNAIQKRLGVETVVRAWQASIAGENTGTVIVGLEYASLAAFADASTKTQNDGEWTSLIGGLDGLRTLLSSGLYREIKP